jgi:coenzyme Q-binding protein COQ10
MSATILETERRLPYDPADLTRLIGDVKSYPLFIPWIKSIRLTRETPNADGWSGIAHAIVGWRAVTERFSTHVRCAPEEGAVDVTLDRGPFRRLENTWRIEPHPQGGSLVRFWIAYEFANPLLNTLAKVNRQTAVDRIIAAFEGEARRRFGEGQGAAR